MIAVYIRPSLYLGGWWAGQYGLASSWGRLVIGVPNTQRNPMNDDEHEICPFPSEESAWEFARRLAQREAAKRGMVLREGTYRGTYGVWRAWLLKPSEEVL